jgi:hypothetical protein
LNADDNNDREIDGDTVEPAVTRVVISLDGDINRTQNKQELEGAVREGLLYQLEEGPDLRDTFDVRSETIILI